MRAILKIWTDAKSEVAADRVVKRAVEQLGRIPQSPKLESYARTGGYIYSCELDMEAATWESCVVEIIGLGQRLGTAWTITGDVRQDLAGWCTQSRIAGLKAMEWILRR